MLSVFLIPVGMAMHALSGTPWCNITSIKSPVIIMLACEQNLMLVMWPILSTAWRIFGFEVCVRRRLEMFAVCACMGCWTSDECFACVAGSLHEVVARCVETVIVWLPGDTAS